MKNKEYWESVQGKSLKKLIVWGIFIFIIFAVGLISSITTNNSNDKTDVINNGDEPVKEVTKTYNDMLKELLNNDFTFDYNIQVGELNYYIKGTKENNIFSGYKETKEDVIKFKIVDNQVYHVILDEEIAVDNFYDNLVPEYINLDFINLLINNLNIKENNKYSAIIDDIEYEVTIQDEHIYSILIKNANFEYNFSFSNIKDK